jgi:hypothetical protein
VFHDRPGPCLRLCDMSHSEKHPCPCCGHLTLPEPPPGTFALCTYCGWEDDPVPAADPDYRGGANGESLNESREAYRLRSAAGLHIAT